MLEYGESNFAKMAFRKARWEVAKWWLKLHSDIDTIGITGSVGKTTTKELVGAVLSERFKSVVTSGNLDPIFNLPVTVLKLNGADKFVAEMGVDKPGQMDAYLNLVCPRIGVLTRLSLAHLDKNHFGSLEGVIKEKRKLVESLPKHGWAVLNGDDELIMGLTNKIKANILSVGYGKDCDLRIKNFKQVVSKGKILSSFTLDHDFGEEKFEVNLLGKHNVLLSCMAIAVGMIEGMDFGSIRKGLKKALPVKGRLLPVWRGGRLIIDDTYNASPEAVKAAVDVLLDLDLNGTFVLGDMLELGKESKTSHFMIGEYLYKQGVKRVGLYGEEAANVASGYLKMGGEPNNVFTASSHSELIEWLRFGKETVLVKGSRGMRMDKVVSGLLSLS